MPEIQHKDIPDQYLHEPKGVADAALDSVYHADGSGSGIWKPIVFPESEQFDPSTINVRRVLDGASSAGSQNPTGIGDSGAIQIEFGSPQGTVDDEVSLSADGTVTVNKSRLFRIKIALQFGRTGSASVSHILFRVLVNGVQAGRSIAYLLDDSNTTMYVENDEWIYFPAGTTVRFEIMRDAAGDDSGGLVQYNPSGGWNSAPTAAIRMQVLE